MLPGANTALQNIRPSGRDRSGEERYLNIAGFNESGFPAVLAGESYFADVTLAPRPRPDGTVLPARTITVERCQAISLRKTLEGEPYLAISDENIDFRFMPLRDKAVTGLDADENGAKISVAELTQMVSANFAEYLTKRTAPAVPDDGSDLDALAI